MTKPVLVVGSLNMDMVVRAPCHPQVSETILGTFFTPIPAEKVPSRQLLQPGWAQR